MNDSSKQIGENGGMVYDSTATLSGFFYQVDVQEDTVIATLTETGSVDVTGSTEWNVSGKTLKAGAILTPYREHFTDIAITSGSVIVRHDGR